MADENVFPKGDGDIWYASDANAVAFGNFEAGENLTAGDVVYINKSDGKAYKSDTGTADDIRADGIAINTANAAATVDVQQRGNYVTSGLTANEVYYLGAAGAISTTASGVEIGTATSTTNLFINIVQDDKDHVGTIKAWHEDFTGMPSNVVTAFWKECDGSVLSDAESPFDGQTLPDLNGTTDTDSYFLRGNTTTGTTGGSATHNHSHSGSWGADVCGPVGCGMDLCGGCVQPGTVSTQNTIPPFMNVKWLIKIK